jgi:hypothetical protein
MNTVPIIAISVIIVMVVTYIYLDNVANKKFKIDLDKMNEEFRIECKNKLDEFRRDLGF